MAKNWRNNHRVQPFLRVKHECIPVILLLPPFPEISKPGVGITASLEKGFFFWCSVQNDKSLLWKRKMNTHLITCFFELGCTLLGTAHSTPRSTGSYLASLGRNSNQCSVISALHRHFFLEVQWKAWGAELVHQAEAINPQQVLKDVLRKSENVYTQVQFS